MSVAPTPTVIPAKAGTHLLDRPRARQLCGSWPLYEMGPRFRGGDEAEHGDAR